MTLDLATLRRLAEAARDAPEQPREWLRVVDMVPVGMHDYSDADFIAACSPRTILALLARKDAAEQALAAAYAALAPLDDVVAALGIADDETLTPVAAVREIIAERDTAQSDARRLREALSYVLTAHGEQLHDAFEQARAALAQGGTK